MLWPCFVCTGGRQWSWNRKLKMIKGWFDQTCFVVHQDTDDALTCLRGPCGLMTGANGSSLLLTRDSNLIRRSCRSCDMARYEKGWQSRPATQPTTSYLSCDIVCSYLWMGVAILVCRTSQQQQQQETYSRIGERNNVSISSPLLHPLSAADALHMATSPFVSFASQFIAGPSPVHFPRLSVGVRRRTGCALGTASGWSTCESSGQHWTGESHPVGFAYRLCELATINKHAKRCRKIPRSWLAPPR